jgi:hypothetical protein
LLDGLLQIRSEKRIGQHRMPRTVALRFFASDSDQANVRLRIGGTPKER